MKPGAGWPIGIVLILATSVIANFAVMRIAANDPSFAVEPDYYAKAIAYDSTLAQARINSELGWTAFASIAPDSTGQVVLSVRLATRDGESVEGASVSAVALFVARASEADSVVLREATPGDYRASIARPHDGRWEVRVVASRDSERFTATLRTEATVTSALRAGR